MNKSPLISVIMPVYNADRYLREALDSILRQTYRNFELIIVNDGSSDGSADIITHYEKADSRIKAFTQKNSGVVAAANFGASVATGQYLMRSDADDISFNTKLADLIACAIEHPKAIVISGNIEVINERSEFLYRDILCPFNEEIKREMFIRNPIPNGATLIKKSAFDAVGGYDDVFAEDFHLWIKLFPLGDFVATGTYVYRWRTNSTGLTFSNIEKSIQKEKEYVNMLWEAQTPNYVRCRDIRKRSHLYVTSFKKHGREYNHLFLSNFARFSVHMGKHGHRVLALKQLTAVAFSSVAGFEFVIVRVFLVIRGGVESLLRKFRILRPDTHLPDFD
jgi:glycosyltransferase involved in cell wall biosynthesis